MSDTMGMWNDTCKCIDENWKALKARIQASITGITVNGVTHYQTDGTGICDLGEIEGTTDANEIFLKDGRSVETAIVTIDTALPGKVIDVEPSAVTGGINLNETDGNGTTARMLIRADDSLAFDGLQIGISDKTDTRITEALNTATTAGNKADDAQTDADSAMTAATTANGTANTAMARASVAFAGATVERTDNTFKTTFYDADNNPTELPTLTAGTNLTFKDTDTGFEIGQTVQPVIIQQVNVTYGTFELIELGSTVTRNNPVPYTLMQDLSKYGILLFASSYMGVGITLDFTHAGIVTDVVSGITRFWIDNAAKVLPDGSYQMNLCCRQIEEYAQCGFTNDTDVSTATISSVVPVNLLIQNGVASDIQPQYSNLVIFGNETPLTPTLAVYPTNIKKTA